MKIALVHDDFLQWGGAERVVQAFSEVWPKAPIYTSVADEEIIARWLGKRHIVQSILQYAPQIKRFRKAYLPLYPLAFQHMELHDYDIVLSSSSRFAHTIKLTNGTRHISYCHAPPRFIWRFDHYLKNEEYPRIKKFFVRPTIPYFKRLDELAMQNIDTIIANSRHIAKQIKSIYNRNAIVLPPFVDMSLFKPTDTDEKEDYYLVVSRLAPWKRIDLAIESCRRLNLPLVVIGKGSDKNRLKNLACGTKTEFLEELTDKQLVGYYRNCKALIITQEEDFGLTALEAQACGKPVLAFGRGGVTETVMKGKTGDFFPYQTVESLTKKLKMFHTENYISVDCYNHAATFSKIHFKEQIKQYVQGDHQNTH